MHSRTSKGSLTLALGGSLFAHLTVLVPLLLAVMTAEPVPHKVEAMISSAAMVDEEREEPQQALGIEQSTASTFTWIGYEEYQEHLARLAEIEQAAFTDEPSGSNSVIEAVEQADARPHVELSPEAVEAINHLRSIFVPAQLPRVELPSFARAMEAIGLRTQETDRGEAEERVETAVEVPTPSDERSETTSEETDSAATHGEIPQEVSDSGSTPGTPGDAADKQSDPTAIIEAPSENWRLGRPLAAEGIELKPQRPVFSIVQRLTSSPCNPLVEMHFNRAGIVTNAFLVEGSRDQAIDTAVQASAYRWRAEGADLEQLGEEGTFTVRIRFILNPYARCP